MKIAIDFDNTFYTPKRDVDDALAFLYLLSFSEVDIVSVTSTFGNASIEEVDRDTRQLLSDIGHTSIPYAVGGRENGDYLTPASQLLAQMADEYAGELIILATGSMTNLQGAYLRDPDFFKKVKQIVIMGGVTAPLIFPKGEMLELNLSCDPQASYTVLTKGQPVHIMTANHCLDLLFTREDYEASFIGDEGPLAKLIQEYSDPWFVDNEEEYGIPGYYNWDSLAAAYIARPEYFTPITQDFTVSIQVLATGQLQGQAFDTTTYSKAKPIRTVPIHTPRIAEGEALKQDLFNRWKNLDQFLQKD